MLANTMRRIAQAGVLALLGPMAALAVEPGPWLGVALEPVPPPLLQHLQIERGGLMIADIASDSPAEKAGLRQFDVLLETDGRPVPDVPAKFIEMVHRKRPGEIIKLAVIQAGQRRDVELTLAAQPPDSFAWQWRHPNGQGWPPMQPDLRGKILRRGPHGWVWDDLGPVPPTGMEDRLRSYVENLLPRESEALTLRRLEKDGGVLQIRVDKDGTIEVKRYSDRDGERQAEIRSFTDAEQLKQHDPEAYEFYESQQRDHAPRKHFTPAPEAVPPDWHEWADEARSRIRQWREDLNRYQEDLKRWEREYQHRRGDKDWEKNWREWSQRFFQGPLQPLKPEAPLLGDAARPPQADGDAEDQFHFEVLSDGSISVEYLDQGARLTRRFSSEADLKATAPDLYARFKGLNDRLMR